MGIIRCADRNQINRRIVDNGAPVIRITAETKVGGALRCAFGAKVANNLQPWPETGSKNRC